VPLSRRYNIVVPYPESTGRYAEALSLLECFRQTSDLQSVMACIEIFEALLAESVSLTDIDASVPSSGNPDCDSEVRRARTRRYHILIQLAWALRERHDFTGQDSDLDAAIARGRTALAICHIELMLCPTVLIIHASLLLRNARRTGDRVDLHMAELMCRQGLGLCSTVCTLSATASHILGWIMYRLYEAIGTPAYLDEALNLQRRVLNLTSATHDTDYHQYLRALAVYTNSQYKDKTDPHDIEYAMSILEQCLELCPEMHINRILIVHTMLNILQRKYDLCGKLEDLNRGIDLGRQIMAIPNFPDGDRRLLFLTALSNLLFVGSQVALSTGDDLEESVNLRREALQCASLSPMSRWTCAGNLARALRFRYTQKGDLEDLEECFELYRHAIDLLPEGHPERPILFACLSEVLCDRFRETRDVASLDEALVWSRYAMAAMSPSHVDYCDVSQLAISHLCIRFEAFQAVDDLDQAILLSEDSLKILPDEHAQKYDTIRHLAKALLLRGAHMNARKDIDRAIHEVMPVKERLAQSMAASEVSRTLAASYLVRFRLSQGSRDATHAMTITNELLNTVGPNHYERFQCLVHAAELYLEHGTPFHDVEIAVGHIEEALLNNCRDVRSKLQGAKSFLDLVKAHYEDVRMSTSPAISAQLLDIYTTTISLLPRVAFFGLHLRSRLQSLAMGQGIALDGASHALGLSLPKRALEMLEQGRVIFWNHTLRLRSPFGHVPGEFRDRLAYLARQLDKSSDILPDTHDSRTIEKAVVERRQQSEEFNSLIDRIRCLPGLKRFLLHDEYATLVKAADKGPVVVLVSSALGCHAIIVKSADEIISILLDTITESWLEQSGSFWRTEALKATSSIRDGRKMVKMGNPSKAVSTEAEDNLKRLWTFVVFPDSVNWI
jgi:tetratricopeptide (TPR) repeat protein